MIRSILMSPVWLLQLFGMSKSFRDNPILGSAVLNRMGLHVARLVLAHGITRFRWWLLAPLASRDHRHAFHQSGFVEIPDFVDEAEFGRIVREVGSCEGEVRECIQGDTLTHRILLDDHALETMPTVRALVSGSRYERLLMYCAARFRRPIFYIQSIKNMRGEGAGDPQKNMHADTFHPTMKAWLFLEDVDERNGPFTYVPQSHRLTTKRLIWEYRHSIGAARDRDPYSQKGSFRVMPEDLDDLGLGAPVELKVKANTLVVANTHGFHCRGSAGERSSRLEIWAFGRSNPFNPFPGLGLRAASRLEYRLAKAYWRYKDREAERRKVQSSWHLVPSEKMWAKHWKS